MLEASISGCNLIDGKWTAGRGNAFASRNASTGEPFGTFAEADDKQISDAVRSASKSFAGYRTAPIEVRARFLEIIAEQLEYHGPAIVEAAMRETALPAARLQGEMGRTTGQLRMFAKEIRGSDWLGIRIDEAMPDRQPAPRPELRRVLLPIGPVAVFGASNFPLAFSVAGGDTASALAAGCPVIVKAHPAHPATSELVAAVLANIVQELALPSGTFSMIHASQEVARRLVGEPGLAAVAFTGSQRGGLALLDEANRRKVPIPVFAEMGSVNPIFVLPAAAAERGDSIAQGYVQSLTLGVGQFCTNPGVVFVEQGSDLADRIRDTLADAQPGTMLTEAIGSSYCDRATRWSAIAGVETLILPSGPGSPGLFRCRYETYRRSSELRDELFGPAGLIVECEGAAQMIAAAELLDGQLTATIHFAEGDAYRPLASILETKAGRLVFNGFPTGVEVCSAMQHGGPFPATTDSRFTSVGTAAIERFLRPVCYQNAPADALPEPLRGAP